MGQQANCDAPSAVPANREGGVWCAAVEEHRYYDYARCIDIVLDS
ncbi:hypothetical protein WMF20_02200 [Sorangium sp. So ce834]